MIFDKGYTVRKIRTSHGTDIYLSRFGNVVKVLPCSPQKNLTDGYVTKLINQIQYFAKIPPSCLIYSLSQALYH